MRGATFIRNSTKVWKAFGSRYSDGWLYANNLKLTGQTIVYVYEDFQTAIMGQFIGGKFINGSAAKIAANRCKGGIMELKMEQSAGTKYAFKYIGAPENLQKLRKEASDPIEEENVYVASSEIPEGGEGLFAKKVIGLGSVIAMYSGLMVKATDVFQKNMSQAQKELRHRNLLSFNQSYLIDVPSPYDKLINYKATLGHKANHSFQNNAKFGLIKSPRFGETKCLIATKNILKGEEILVNYAYDMNKFAPEWYKELHAKTYK